MTEIIIFVVLGVLLLVVEMLVLPGFTVAGIASLGACGYAVYKGFADFGTQGGLLTLGAVLVLSIIVAVFCLRAKTWKRFTLKKNIDGTSMTVPEQDGLSVGDRGMTIGRLAPMGKVLIDGKTYEAKSVDSYIDPRQEIEVTGFENFNVVVRKINTSNE